MQRNNLLLCAVAAGLCACGGSQGYTIEGPAGDEGYAVLRIIRFEGEVEKDTVALRDGKFRFTGVTDDVYMGDVTVFEKEKEPVRYSLLVENSPLVLSDGQFKGGPNNDFMLDMDAVSAGLDQEAPNYREQLVTAMNACFAAHPDIEAAAFYYYVFNRETPIGPYEEGFNLFTQRVQESALGKNAREEIRARKATGEGVPAPLFTLNDANGNPVSLESLRGHYVLLDFWASWCIPCRESMPYVKSLYAAYHSKGLEILGISTDSDAKAWHKAMEEIDTPWLHVIDTDTVAKLYGVHAIPTFFLIDPEGVMVGKMEHEELEDRLHRLLD